MPTLLHNDLISLYERTGSHELSYGVSPEELGNLPSSVVISHQGSYLCCSIVVVT
jgi:hypothetical protein